MCKKGFWHAYTYAATQAYSEGLFLFGGRDFYPRCEMAGIPSGLANREPATEGYRPGWRRFTGNGPNKVPYTYARIRCTNVMYALLCMLWTHCWDIYDPHFLSHAGALPCVNIAPPAYNYKSFFLKKIRIKLKYASSSI